MTGPEPAMVASGERWSVSARPAALTTAERLEADVRDGLSQTPPSLPARWFYDERGSLLFDQITQLPEYYPTRRETEILADRADEIARLTAASTLVELGSGTSTKTRLLLDALSARGPVLFVPIDVSVEVLTGAGKAIAADYPSVTVHALVADFDDPLAPLPGEPGDRLVAFLGGTIGNLDRSARDGFLDRLRGAMGTGDHFLLGADLRKDPARLVAAYDDAAGVTAAFNRNLIEVLRRELDADRLDPDAFDHVARWNDQASRIEMWLRANRDVDVSFRALDLGWKLPAGEEMLTEISVKFDLADLHGELSEHGFEIARGWTDRAGDFSLTLARAR